MTGYGGRGGGRAARECGWRNLAHFAEQSEERRAEGRIARAGCHGQDAAPGCRQGKGPAARGRGQGPAAGCGGPRPPQGSSGARAPCRSGGRRRWNSAESAPRPLGGTCGIPAAGRAGRAGPGGPGRGAGRAQRPERRRGRAGAGRSPAAQVNTGRRLPPLTSLHPGGVRSSLASPHGNSRSSSGNCPGRRQRWQLLLRSRPGRRLDSAPLASPRPGCSRRTRRHLGRATSASPRDVRSHWPARRARASCDRLHGAGARRDGGGRWVARDPASARLAGSPARTAPAAEAAGRRASPRPRGDARPPACPEGSGGSAAASRRGGRNCRPPARAAAPRSETWAGTYPRPPSAQGRLCWARQVVDAIPADRLRPRSWHR